MIGHDDILSVLRTVDDPEMPISIVDLGLVARVDIAGRGDNAVVTVDLVPTFIGCPALFVIEKEVHDKLCGIPGVGTATVNWVYDPPWSVDRISSAGRAQLAAAGITVPHEHSGEREAAATVVQLGLPGRRAFVACPLCQSEDTTLEGAFGPTRCKMIYYCKACRNAFEHMKRI